MGTRGPMWEQCICQCSHPLLEKLDNTEVKQVNAEPGCSQSTDKHVHLSITMKIVFLKLFSSSNRAHVGRLALCLCHELGGGEKDGDCTYCVADNQDGNS